MPVFLLGINHLRNRLSARKVILWLQRKSLVDILIVREQSQVKETKWTKTNIQNRASGEGSVHFLLYTTKSQ